MIFVPSVSLSPFSSHGCKESPKCSSAAMQEIRDGRQAQAMFDLDGFHSLASQSKQLHTQTHTLHVQSVLPGVSPGQGFASSWEMSGDEIGHH